MNITYFQFESIPEQSILNGILQLHQKIFGSADNLVKQMQGKRKLLVQVAMEGSKVIGYKIGYELNDDKFYSWLGGVDETYRNYGIASKLMEKQHQFLTDCGYKIVQTKTKNKWRSMLILNIKSGFDVIGTYTDDKGEPKIILEKRLLRE